MREDVEVPEDSAATVRRQTLELIVEIRQAALSRRHRRGLSQVTGIDVPTLERWVLHAIEGATLVPVARLAAELHVDMPSLSRACRRLELEGRLIRVEDPRDRRRTLVGLSDATAEAMAVWDAAWPTPYLRAAAGRDASSLDCLSEWLRLVRDSWFDEFGSGLLRLRSQPRSSTSSASSLRFECSLRDFVGVAGRTDDLTAVLHQVTERPPTSGEFRILSAIAADPAVRLRDLAASEDVDPSLARRQMKRLADKGFLAPTPEDDLLTTPVHRSELGSDARQLVTQAGQSLLDEVAARRLAAVPEPPTHLIRAGLAPTFDQFATRLRRS